MNPHLPTVRAWCRDMQSVPLHAAQVPVSAENLQAAVVDATDAFTDAALEAAAARLVPPPGPRASALLIAPSTVSTAPLEWLVLLWLSGHTITWSTSRRAPGLATCVTALAATHGLPLHCTTREAAPNTGPQPSPPDTVVVLGADQTVAAVRQTYPHAKVLGFGHTTSAAWWGQFATTQDLEGLVADIARHDTRGCMSPAVVLTDRPLAEARDLLHAALVEAESRWPRGHLTAGEGAAIRARSALAAVLGPAAPLGAPTGRHHVLVLPPTHANLVALPRTVQLVPVADATAACDWLRTRSASWSTLGTPAAHADALQAVPAARHCRLGQMQRPPLIRHHDGLDHIGALARG